METFAVLLVLAFGTHTFTVKGEKDVVIIGAGASGLAAARALTDGGQFKVTVLEARSNRYGGRIWTNTESFTNATGPEVDMGASFIHYPLVDDNSVVKLHQKFNLPMLDTNLDNFTAVREKDSMPYTETRITIAEKKVKKAFEAVWNYSSSLKTDISVYEALRKTNQSQFIDDPLSQMFVSLEEFSSGSPINKLGTISMDVGYEDVIETPEKIPAHGYTKMLDRIVQNSLSDTALRIILGQVVKEVTVREDRRVVIKCKNNITYEADAVIVTLPLGVLKAGSVKFSPALPEKKRRAIERIGFGTVNKLVLQFDKRFWPEHTQHFTVAIRNIADRGKFSLFSSFYAIANKPVMVAYATSHFGKQSEKLKNKQLKNLALDRLRTIFGTIMNTVTIVKMSRTQWYKDPFAKGSYSFPAVGTRDGDWDIVGEPVAPLFFAGEHTRTKFYGMVQNAIDTGRRAAKEVEQYLKDEGNSAPLKSVHNGLILCSIVLSVLQAGR